MANEMDRDLLWEWGRSMHSPHEAWQTQKTAGGEKEAEKYF